MQGHLRKRSKNTWTLQLFLGNDPVTGKKKYRSITIKGTRRDAERERVKLVNQLNEGNFIPPQRITLGQWLQRWLVEFVSPRLRPKTETRYRGIVNHYLIPKLGVHPITSLQPLHVHEYEAQAQQAGISQSSIAYHHRILSQALNDALRMGVVGRNVAALVRQTKPSTRAMRTLTWIEVQAILDATGRDDLRLFYLLAVLTGLRRSELLAIRWRDVDLDRGEVSVSRGLHQLPGGERIFLSPKSKTSKRVAPLPPTGIQALRSYGVGVPDQLILSLSPSAVSDAFPRIASHAGLSGTRLHDLRHTFASLMLAEGANLKQIQEWMGHSSIAITADLYTHLIPGAYSDQVHRFGATLEWQQNGKFSVVEANR